MRPGLGDRGVELVVEHDLAEDVVAVAVEEVEQRVGCGSGGSAPYEPPLPELADWFKSPVQCIWTGDGYYYRGTVMRINKEDNTVGVLCRRCACRRPH